MSLKILTPDAQVQIDMAGGATNADICVAAAMIILAASLMAGLARNPSDSKLNVSFRFGMGRLSASAAATRVVAEAEINFAS